jgi:hypothetical protein
VRLVPKLSFQHARCLNVTIMSPSVSQGQRIAAAIVPARRENRGAKY